MVKPATNRARVHEARAKTLAQQGAFLAAFAKVGVITEAATRSGVDRQRHYEWLADPEKYPGYAERYAEANEQACDALEAEAVRRGAEGWEEPVYQGGKLVGRVVRHSDRMLELVLKARLPEKYRERQSMELTGKGGGPLETRNTVDVGKLSSETLRRLAAELDGG